VCYITSSSVLPICLYIPRILNAQPSGYPLYPSFYVSRNRPILCILWNIIILQLRIAPRLSTRNELNEKGDLKLHSPNITVCTRAPLSAIGTNCVWRPCPWVDRWSSRGRLSGVARYAVLGKSGMFPVHVSGLTLARERASLS
jgi:hypothetical protein